MNAHTKTMILLWASGASATEAVLYLALNKIFIPLTEVVKAKKSMNDGFDSFFNSWIVYSNNNMAEVSFMDRLKFWCAELDRLDRLDNGGV